MMRSNQQPWLNSPKTDFLFVLFPPLFSVVIILIFNNYFSTQMTVTAIWWIILILCIDVAHVYSTIFRLYWDQNSFTKFKYPLIFIPIISLIIGVVFYNIGPMVFWRVVAYIAVFHFVRQQYGFMRLYSRKEIKTKLNTLIDNLCIYNATLYPLVYWHMYRTDEISWFVSGDFFQLPETLFPFFNFLYWLLIVVYLGKEGYQSYKQEYFNVPKNLLIIGTYMSWHLGIITFHGDLIFTMLNVISHGIPYMALVYFYGEKKAPEKFKIPLKTISIFLISILLLAYFEEGLWDIFVWKEHGTVFPLLTNLPVLEGPVIAFIVPLLTLPQITHYVLDGFIWKISSEPTLGN